VFRRERKREEERGRERERIITEMNVVFIRPVVNK
jgi:hypothetical protein